MEKKSDPDVVNTIANTVLGVMQAQYAEVDSASALTGVLAAAAVLVRMNNISPDAAMGALRQLLDAPLTIVHRGRGERVHA